ncbi:helix-turn-helix domain-containing protein [Roseibium polysiphoniae]|uniref:helix-turn-helix transcriptional regulator n=1 Tax=Roseibium polysiphoniae TaxID=2571221 RepID=UPI003299C906
MDAINKLKSGSQLLTEVQAAEALNLSVRTLQAWRVRGSGPNFVKLSRAVRYRVTDLDDWLNANCRGSTSETEACK